MTWRDVTCRGGSDSSTHNKGMEERNMRRNKVLGKLGIVGNFFTFSSKIPEVTVPEMLDVYSVHYIVKEKKKKNQKFYFYTCKY